MRTAVQNIVNRIKVAARDLQNYSYTEFQRKLPSYIHKHLGYGILNSLFMQETGTTIKNYFYRTKLEIADELIRHYRLEAHEVAYQLGYKQPGRIGVNRNM